MATAIERTLTQTVSFHPISRHMVRSVARQGM